MIDKVVNFDVIHMRMGVIEAVDVEFEVILLKFLVVVDDAG